MNRVAFGSSTVAGCMQNADPASPGWGFVRIALDGSFLPSGAITSGKIEPAGEVNACVGIYVKTSTEFYAYVSFQTSGVHKLAKITTNTF